jgi:hypothetical protein
MHVSEDDLVLHYYGEGERPEVERHLTTCAECRQELDRLRRVLALVDDQPIPEPSPAFERSMWARLEPQLSAPQRGWWSRLFASPARLAWAGGLAMLLVAAFVAGRFSRPDATVAPSDVAASANDRVLVIAVVDHLDRSQMMLVELLNGALDDPAGLSNEQSRARELVVANRLYRLSATQMGDETIGETLDDLGRVLLEIANAPADVSSIDLAALRERIEARGLLFRVRVVQSEMQERERNTRIIG